uniref:Uncharacterized protein n=1 Tax=Anopheles atroparvus TaxID=41427 RepID=A0A182IU32_ANOAO
MRRKQNAGVSTPEKATPRRSTRGRGRRSPSKSPEPEPDTDERDYDVAQDEEKNSSSDEESTSRKGTGKTRGARGRSTSSRRKTDERPPSRARRNSRREKEPQEENVDEAAVDENGAEMQEVQSKQGDHVDTGTAPSSGEVMEPIPEEETPDDTESTPAVRGTDAGEEEERQDEHDGSKEDEMAEHDDKREASDAGENAPAVSVISRELEEESKASEDTEEKVSQKNGDEEEEETQDDGDKQEKAHSRDEDAHDDSKEVVNNRSRTREESDSNESGQEEGEIVGKDGEQRVEDKDESTSGSNEEESKRADDTSPATVAVSASAAEEDGKKITSTDKGQEKPKDDEEGKKTKASIQPLPPRRRPRFSSRPDQDLSPVKPVPGDTDQNDDELEAGEIKDTDQSMPEANANVAENSPVKEAPRIRPLQRKRRWLSSKNADSKPAVITISTDSLKNIISDVKPVPLADVKLDSSSEPEGADGSVSTEEDDKERTRQRNSRGSIDSNTQQPQLRRSVSNSAEKENIQVMEEGPEEENANEDGVLPKQKPPMEKITVTRKISIVSDDGSIATGAAGTGTVRPPSPAKHHTSNILYITNLVRPFTVLQLKGLLARTGKIVENGFWIDKIKSKCFVKYETEDEATETRHALHGIRWPVSNPKCLIVDFGGEEAMEKAILSTLEDGAIRSTVDGAKEGKEFGWSRDASKKDENTPRPVREWDLGKKETLDQERDRNGRPVGRDRERETFDEKDKSIADRTGRDRERDRGRAEDGQRDARGNRMDASTGDRSQERKRSTDPEFGRDRRRSASMSPARKLKKKENEPPIRLLDDLFRKTKATPCIYWLPLTTEQIAVKEEQRRKNMAEHQRRLDEQRKLQEEERERERKRERERRERERERDRERELDRERDRERDRDRDRDRRRTRSRERSRDDGGRRRHR